MALTMKRPYACPVCRESFLKWGPCLSHVRGSAPCRDTLGDKLQDLDAVQEACRSAAGAAPDGRSPGPAGVATASAGAVPAPPGLPAAPAEPAPPEAPADLAGGAAAPPTQPQPAVEPAAEPGAGQVIVSATQKLDRAIQRGTLGPLSGAERRDLESKLEGMAVHSAKVQDSLRRWRSS
ncbi:unnamed protein product [Prorocentrum cordatum]|uniref:RING-type E3 ubiquitin transferase n=1 Tax=Prorocentrum cordatum TaxID=2364126 RepID=A0ABN9QM36_9DINO|nr:unnamed protein product [Polarella glacialis]